MVVCDRLCLHEAVCDACSMFEPVPLLCVQYTLYMAEYMTEWVCVFQSWGARWLRCWGPKCANREVVSGPRAYWRESQGPGAEEKVKAGQLSCELLGPVAHCVLSRVQVCFDLLLQQAVSKETEVCCSYPEGKLLLQEAQPGSKEAPVLFHPPLPPPLEPVESSENIQLWKAFFIKGYWL